MGIYRKWYGYVDDKGRVFSGRKADGWPIDDKAPDGFTVSGYRTIDRQSFIRFAGVRWTDPSYEPGGVVFCKVDHPLGAEIKTVAVDVKWTPDTIGDDISAFVQHSHEFRRAVRPEEAPAKAKGQTHA